MVVVADVILQSIRESDFDVRFDGDEFCCLLADASDQTNNLITEPVLKAIK
jgi:GGDEF domain-containing protein